MRGSRVTRTDAHSPTNLVTESYDYVGSYDRNPPVIVVGPNANGQYFVQPDPDEPRRRRMEALLAASADHRQDGSCDHCGARGLRYIAVLKYRPTGSHIGVGVTCLENRFELATADFQQLRKQAELERKGQRIKKAIAEFCTANPDLAWMRSMPESWVKVGMTEDGAHIDGRRVNYFVLDVSHKLRRYGTISERQADAVRASLAKDAEFAAQRAARDAERAAAEATRPPRQQVPSGRQTVTGLVLAAKSQDSHFGTQYKWLVEDDRGFKVWGSVPTAVLSYTAADGIASYRSIQGLRGLRVSFSAELEPSRTRTDIDDNAAAADPFFGFYKRPTQAKVLAEAVEGSGK